MKLYLILLILLFVAGCGGVNTNLVMVKDGDTLPQNICKDLDNRVIVVHKTGCPACAIALPILQEIEKEKGLKFEYYNTMIAEEREALLKLNFVTQHVPALVYKCKVYEGALDKEKYLEILNVS